MKKSYHSSAEPTAEASITRPSDDLSRTTPAPVTSAVMVSLPARFVLVVVVAGMLDQPPGTRQADGAWASVSAMARVAVPRLSLPGKDCRSGAHRRECRPRVRVSGDAASAQSGRRGARRAML